MDTCRGGEMKVLSLGWGVQSFTLAAMVALGELEPIDAAIHADTGHEASWTYEFARKWTTWLEKHGLKIITIHNGTNENINEYGGVEIPAYMHNGKSKGVISRQCTGRWNIKPMRRWLQENRDKHPVEMWLGISIDEFQRMKDSDVKYITNRFPLIEHKMTRKDCEKWLISHGLEVPQKSACTFCPYHSKKEWHAIKQSHQDWDEAVRVDNAIRKARPPFDLFCSNALKPLDEIDFRTLQERGQLELWENECSGVCGV